MPYEHSYNAILTLMNQIRMIFCIMAPTFLLLKAKTMHKLSG